MKGYVVALGMIKRILATTTVLSLAFILGTAVAGFYHSEPASASGVPDLTIENIALSPENPAIGDTVTITITVKNQGTEQAGSARISCYIDDAHLASEYIDPIDAGATAVKTWTWSAQKGTHTIKAVADSNNQITESNETNNVKTFTLSTLAPDLVIQAISWTPVDSSRGDTITFSVIVKNQGSSGSGSSRVNFYIDGSSRGYQDAYSLDAGATVTRSYTWISTVGQHAVKAVIDEEKHVEESDETNNEKTVTFSTLPPDLIVQDITWLPENPSKNDDVTFTVTIKNQGSGRSDACHVAYYIDETLLTSDYIGQIEAGVSANTTFNWTVVTDSSTIKAIVDSYERVAESDETNNERTASFFTLQPDLVVKGITWSPTDAAVGDTVTFTVTIKNQGGGTAESSRMACYIDGDHMGYFDIPEMEAGTEQARTFIWTAVADAHAVRVSADCNIEVTESNEDNNRETVTIFIIPPDLIIENIAWAPEKPSLGDTVTFTVTIKNQGGGTADSFYTAYYIDETLLASDYIGQIASGASTNTTFNWNAQIGSHTFRVVADTNTMVMENDETNNEKTVTLSPITPDLTIDRITWSPQIISAGDTVTFAVTIKNQGSDRAYSSCAAYYIDGQISGYRDIPEIAAGAAVTENFLWTAAAGAHTIKISLDTNNQVTENDETNNEKTVNIPPPDLIIQDVTFSPANAAVGDTVTLTVTVKNQGSGRAESHSVAYYVDGSAAGSHDVPDINAGAAVTETFTWLAEAGQHVIKVAADASNVVTESDETNNEKVMSYTTLTPDLVIQGITWSQDNPSNSGNVTFSITIENQGGSQADSSRIACYIDGSFVGEHDVPEIDAGGAVTRTLNVTVKDGPHIVKVTADAINGVAEVDETNNEQEMSFSTITPDLVIQGITWSPLSPLPGDNVTFTVPIKNQGRSKAESLSVGLYVDGSLISNHDVPEIAAGDVLISTFTWLAEIGSHEISTVVDLGETVIESNESNNTKHRTLSLRGGTSAQDGTLISTPSQDGGMLDDLWWLLYLAAVVFGSLAIFAVMKSSKKR